MFNPTVHSFRSVIGVLFIGMALAGVQAVHGQSDPRVAALRRDLESGKDPAKVLLNVLKESDRAYRAAAMDVVSPYADASLYIKVIRKIPKASPAVKADIMNWIGREAADPAKQAVLKDLEVKFEQPARQVFIDRLTDKDREVKQAALFALSQIGDPRTLSPVMKLLTGDSHEDIRLAQEALSAFRGDIDRAVARAIPQAQEAGKIAGLELLARRKANANSSAVYAQTQSTSAAVRQTALKTLKDVVHEADFVRLCGMLETAPPDDVEPLQEAIIEALSGQSPEEKFKTLTRRMLLTGESLKHLYYVPLATTGLEKAEETIREGLGKDREEVREEVRRALQRYGELMH